LKSMADYLEEFDKSMQGTRFELAKAYATEIFQIITIKS